MASVQKINEILQRHCTTCAGPQHNWTIETAANCPPGYFIARLAIPDPLTEEHKIVFVGKPALGKKAAQQNVAVQALQWIEHADNPLRNFLEKILPEKQPRHPDAIVHGSGAAEAPRTVEPKVEEVDELGVGFQGESVLCHRGTVEDKQETSLMDHSENTTRSSMDTSLDKRNIFELLCSCFGVEYCERSTTFRSIVHNVIQKWWKPLPQAPSPAIVWDVPYIMNPSQSGYVATLHLNFTETNSLSVQLHQLPSQSFQFCGRPAINKRLAMENASLVAVTEFYKFFPEQQFNYGAKQELNIFLQKALRPSPGQSLYNCVVEKQPGRLCAVEFRCIIQIKPSYMLQESMEREVTSEWMATPTKAKEDAAKKLLTNFLDGLWSTADGFVISPTLKEPQYQPCNIKQDDVDHCDTA